MTPRPALAAPYAAARRRQALLGAAAAVLAQRPRATLAAIAAAARMSRATLHRVFPSREDLVRALALDGVAAAEQALVRARRARRGRLDELFAALVPLGPRFHFLLNEPWIDRDPRLLARQTALFARIDDLLMRERARGVLRDDVPRDWQRRILLEVVWAAWTAVAEGTLASAGRVLGRLRGLLMETLPWLRVPPLEFLWGGPLHVTARELPVLARAPDDDRIVLAVGMAGSGLGLSLLAGPLVAGLVRPEVDDDEARYLRQALAAAKIPWGSLLRIGAGCALRALVR